MRCYFTYSGSTWWDPTWRWRATTIGIKLPGVLGTSQTDPAFPRATEGMAGRKRRPLGVGQIVGESRVEDQRGWQRQGTRYTKGCTKTFI